MASLRKILTRGACVATGLTALASCGSRTGLFIDEPDFLDASFDVNVTPDGSFIDARVDANRDGSTTDVRTDVSIDAPILIDAPDDGPVACVPGTFQFSLATPQLMFVLDRSGSMAYSLTANFPPPFPEPTRWDVLRDSLSQTIVPFTNQIAMGAKFFPSVNANGSVQELACIQDSNTTAIAPALGNANTILNVFFGTPNGGTPTAVGLEMAAQLISTSRAVARAMVVATDGAPNCNENLDQNTCTCTSVDPSGCTLAQESTNCLDDVRTITTIDDIFSGRKIPVYVVGIGVTSSFGTTLDAMAVAGGRPRPGTPKYYQADTPAELTAAFTVVRDSVAKCSYITPSSPTDPNAISVVIGGSVIQRDPTRTEGWDWIDQEYGYLQLFGSACTNATAINVSGTIGCDKDN